MATKSRAKKRFNVIKGLVEQGYKTNPEKTSSLTLQIMHERHPNWKVAKAAKTVLKKRGWYGS